MEIRLYGVKDYDLILEDAGDITLVSIVPTSGEKGVEASVQTEELKRAVGVLNAQ